MVGGTGPCGLLVVDDDERWRAEISAFLQRAGYAVRQAAGGGEALQEARADPPSGVVLEVCLPDLSGYEVCRTLRDEIGDELPIVFVSQLRTEWFDRVAGLLIGADDYLAKPVAPDELLTRMRILLRRKTQRGSRPLPREAGLTKREAEVLHLLSAGLEQAEIAERLVISPKTVGSHIERILRKLGVRSRAQAVALAYRERLVSA